jgi:beta-1,4-mannosyl-glycoprotein beta-1,4-N-acetylglucosaminyltransferase
MIIDAFIFFNEKELVELRVKYLSDIVDRFLIVEADHTHAGKKKIWNFPDILKNNLKEFSHKIHYRQMEVDLNKAETEKNPRYSSLTGNLANLGRSWKVENMQRNYIKNGTKNFSKNDIIMISDLDEIPSKDKISFIKSCDFKTVAPVAFEQAMFHLDCNYINQEKWIGTVAITKELIDSYEPQVFRNNKNRISHFVEAGWTFSSFGGTQKVQEKFEAFAHQEYNNEKFTNQKHIENCAKKGLDLFHRNIQKNKINKNFFPKDLLGLMNQNPIFYFGSNTTF